MQYLKWRFGLAIGRVLVRVGGKLLDAGWSVRDRSALLYDPRWSRDSQGTENQRGADIAVTFSGAAEDVEALREHTDKVIADLQRRGLYAR